MMAEAGRARARRAIAILQEFSIPLVSGVLAGLVWANVAHASYERAMHASPFGAHHPLDFHFAVNELLMVFFFGIATKEITESCLPGGALNPVRKAINPLAGTLGGVLGPIVVYLCMVRLLDAPELRGGWGVPTATDIALAWLVARVVFGARHAAVSYLLLLAVADDGIGLAIIAIFYPDPLHPVMPAWLGLVALGMAAAWLLRRRGVMSFWPYLCAGAFSWYGLYQAHLHPALALVPIVPFMPSRGRDAGLFAAEDEARDDTLNGFERFFKKPVDFGLFAFGLANAGVTFDSVGPATWAVLAGLLVGKTCGISLFGLLAHRLGFPLPDGMGGRTLLLAGLTAGIGLTVALFVAGVAFQDEALRGAAKMGALFSAVAAPLAIALSRVLQIERRLEAAEPVPIAPVPLHLASSAGSGDDDSVGGTTEP